MTKTTFVGLIAVCVTLCFLPAPLAQGSGSAPVLPAGAQARIATLQATHGLDSPWRHALQRVIDPEDYECGPTDFDEWIGGQIAAIGFPTFLDLLNSGAMDFPTFYTAYFDNDASDDTIGLNGKHTREQVKRHKDCKRFWDIYSDDIQLQGMHGADLADDEKMIPVIMFLTGMGEADAGDYADAVQALVASTVGFDHPFLTLNAFALTTEGEEIPGVGDVPDKIVMGEGILEAMEDMGLGQNGPDFIHAHEFAHHVQFELGAFEEFDPTDPDQAERTRYTELMADAFAAYYLAHARGGSFQAKRVVDGIAAAYGVGDCQFGSPGHHGTPNQRGASAQWGTDVATSARKQGHIKSSETMLALFDDELPILVAPDAD